ncbi:MAG: response regulator, partial [Spirochaetaceae bacterium]|nr:response regulator [Spirochaetaceae bacterium]
MDIKTLLKENSIQLFIVFAIFLFMIIFGCAWATSNVEQYMLRSAEEMLNVAEEQIHARLREAETALISLGIAIIEKQTNQGDMLDTGEMQRLLGAVNDTFHNTETHAIGYQNVFWYRPGDGGGLYISGGPWNPPGDFRAEELPWYPLASADPGGITVSTPYQSPRSGRQVITIAAKLQRDDGENYGYLGIDISLKAIARSAAFFQAEAGGYGFLIGPISSADSRLCFLSYPDTQYENVPLEIMGPQYVELERHLRQGTETISSIRLRTAQDTDVVAFYRKTFSGWYAGLAFPKNEYFRDVYAMSIIYSVTSLSMMLILCYFLLRLSMDKIRSDEENRAKSSFLAQVSHEIRTPLNSILGMSEIILRKDVSSDVYEDVSIIRQAGNILLSIINNILDFAKIEIKKIAIETNPYNMASMINDVINIARLRLLDSPVNLFVDLDSGIPAELIGDEVKIRQVLINLINNAIKYTKLGYIKLIIKKEAVTPSPFGDSQIRLIFDVEDTGIGIKQTDMEHLFKEFTRLDMEHNHDIEGTGLGLTIANAFCRAMGGNITAKSTYGKGSTFTAVVVQTYNSSKPIAQVEDPGKRVLIYEDRPAFLQSLLIAFNSLNVQPHCTWDLASFLRDLRTDGYDYAFIPARYAADCVVCLEESGSAVKLTVMLNTDDMSSSFNTGNVHLPIYSATLANILNGVETEKQMFRTNRISFTAPDARILVVDDLPTNLRVAEELMKPYGMKIDTCLSGSEALSLVKRNYYDIVFMDHMMPEMDGLMTTELIRKQSELREGTYFQDLPIVMLTANAMAGQRELFLKNGINDFLAKPINLGKLNSILAAWIPGDKQQKIPPGGAENRPNQNKAKAPPAAPPLIIPGVDGQTGLQNAGGSIDSYKNILSYFAADIRERIPRIQDTAEKGDLASYTTMVHAIKGASRSIGAMELGDAAAELEAAGREKNTGLITEKTGALLEKLRDLLGNIDSVLGKPEAEQDGGMGRGDEEQLPQDVSNLKLEDLREALHSMDTEKINAILSEINMENRNSGVKKFISHIEQFVLLFEYEKAIMTIDQAL